MTASRKEAETNIMCALAKANLSALSMPRQVTVMHFHALCLTFFLPRRRFFDGVFCVLRRGEEDEEVPFAVFFPVFFLRLEIGIVFRAKTYRERDTTSMPRHADSLHYASGLGLVV